MSKNSDEKKRFLQFAIDRPFPPISGGDIRNAQIARSASEVGNTLTLYLSEIGRAKNSSMENAQIIKASIGRNPWGMIKTLHPTTVKFSDEEISEITKVVDEYVPDVVILEGVAFLPLMSIFASRKIHVIVDMHNIESELIKEQFSFSPFYKKIFRAFRRKLQIENAQLDDMNAAELAQRIWVCSKSDRDKLLKMAPHANITVIPNPVPDSRLFEIPIDECRYRKMKMVFVGHLSYFPNMDAITRFIKSGLPNTSLSYPNCLLTVCGRNPGKKLREICNRANVELVENPSEMYPILATSSYTPIAINYGSGTRIKVLEAMAAGVVVCASSKAIEGLDIEDGKHFILAETSNEIGKEITRLFNHPKHAFEIAQAAREMVKRNYHSDVIRANIVDELTCQADF